MTAVPVTRTFVSGEVVLASYFNTNINGPIGFLLAPPIFEGYSAANQSLSNNTFTALTLDTEYVDSAGGHSTVTNTSRYTAVYAGWYNVAGVASFAANATGQRAVRITVSGTTIHGGSQSLPVTTAATICALAQSDILVFCNVGDYVEIQGFQLSGGSLNTAASGGYEPSMKTAWRSN
jgi:hypothetical protein